MMSDECTDDIDDMKCKSDTHTEGHHFYIYFVVQNFLITKLLNPAIGHSADSAHFMTSDVFPIGL